MNTNKIIESLIDSVEIQVIAMTDDQIKYHNHLHRIFHNQYTKKSMKKPNLSQTFLLKYYLSQPNEVRITITRALALKGIKIK